MKPKFKTDFLGIAWEKCSEALAELNLCSDLFDKQTLLSYKKLIRTFSDIFAVLDHEYDYLIKMIFDRVKFQPFPPVIICDCKKKEFYEKNKEEILRKER